MNSVHGRSNGLHEVYTIMLGGSRDMLPWILLTCSRYTSVMSQVFIADCNILNCSLLWQRVGSCVLCLRTGSYAPGVNVSVFWTIQIAWRSIWLSLFQRSFCWGRFLEHVIVYTCLVNCYKCKSICTMQRFTHVLVIDLISWNVDKYTGR